MVEEEEAGEAEVGDQRELLVEPPPCPTLQHSVAWPVALGERGVADAAELDVGGIGAVGEVRVAVAELLGQVELEPLGDSACSRDRFGVIREAFVHVGHGEEHALPVAPPLGLAALERRAVPDRHERVLEHGSRGAVRVHVAGHDRLDPERPGQVAERGVPSRVAALVRALQLDVEAVTAERRREPGGTVRVADGEAVTGAAGQADEPLVQLDEELRVERRREELRLLRPCPRVRGGDQPAEVRVAPRRLDEHRDVRAVRGV